MPPKRHKIFTDSDIETNNVNGTDSEKKLKRSIASKNLRQSLDQSSTVDSHIPGPLNLGRLNDLVNGDVHLTDSDARFPKSSTSSGSTGSHSSSPSTLDPSDDDEPQNNNSIISNGSLTNGKSISSKNVQFFDSEDEDLSSDSNGSRPNLLKAHASKLLQERKSLPVYKSRAKILDRIFSNRVTILLGETGSGKSTQLPQLIYNRGTKERIAITQPRRVAAVNLATRVAKEMGVVLGSRVGYSVRFQNKSNPIDTHIKYVTDGMLMREIMLDPELSRYTTVIIDEAHERTVTSDILMGLLKQLYTTTRPDLRIVIMSATLNAEKFSKFFDNAQIIYVEGKQYPVERVYLKQSLDDVVDGAVQTVCQINLSEPEGGDILCFLAGQDEIDRCVDRIESIRHHLPKQAPLLIPIPLYASLPNTLQQRAFQKVKRDDHRSQRKVIFATNIAETSVTIPGVRYVIDTGLRKTRVWKPALGLDTLLVTSISQASAQQRSGRAGREAPGKCYRLYSEETYLKQMSPETEAEIVRSNISSTILMLKNVGVDDLFAFPWLEQPSVQSITSGLFNLYGLKALDDDGKITALGKQMALLPISPHLAAILIRSAGTKSDPASRQLMDTVLDIVACLSVEDLLVTPRPSDRDEINANRAQLFPRGVQYGDIVMLADAYRQYMQLPNNGQREWCKSVGINGRSMRNVTLARNQLYRYLANIVSWLKIEDAESAETTKEYVTPESILQCFLYGYKNNVAFGLPDRRYRTIGGGNQMISIHPSSMVFGKRYEAIMYLEYVYTSKNYARMVSPIKAEWLET